MNDDGQGLPADHNWVIDGAGVWESYYFCGKCGQRVRIDTDGSAKLTSSGCAGNKDNLA